jgi:hypothetical protein
MTPYAGDEFYPDEVTSGPIADALPTVPPGRTCLVCVECGVACTKTDDGLCWECSAELGGEA